MPREKVSREDALSQIKSIVQYCEDTGDFIWIKHRVIKMRGQVCGSLYAYRGKLYRKIWILGHQFMAHRLVWFYFYGKSPVNGLDHIDGDSLNNRIENLRDVSQQENTRNARLSKRNNSGKTGVTWHKKYKKWHAYIGVNLKLIDLGLFTDLNEAISVRRDAEIKYGFHQNHGKEKVWSCLTNNSKNLSPQPDP